MYVHAAYYPRIHTAEHTCTLFLYIVCTFCHLSFISCSCSHSFKSVGVHASFAHWWGMIFITHSSWQICFRYFLKILFGWLRDLQQDSDLRFWFGQCKAFTCLLLNTLVLLLLCVCNRRPAEQRGFSQAYQDWGEFPCNTPSFALFIQPTID